MGGLEEKPFPPMGGLDTVNTGGSMGGTRVILLQCSQAEGNCEEWTGSKEGSNFPAACCKQGNPPDAEDVQALHGLQAGRQLQAHHGLLGRKQGEVPELPTAC